MTPPEDWRRAMHDHDQEPSLRWTLQGLAIIAAVLSVGLIAMGAGFNGWWGCVPGGLGLLGAAVLWWEV